MVTVIMIKRTEKRKPSQKPKRFVHFPLSMRLTILCVCLCCYFSVLWAILVLVLLCQSMRSIKIAFLIYSTKVFHWSIMSASIDNRVQMDVIKCNTKVAMEKEKWPAESDLLRPTK